MEYRASTLTCCSSFAGTRGSYSGHRLYYLCNSPGEIPNGKVGGRATVFSGHILCIWGYLCCEESPIRFQREYLYCRVSSSILPLRRSLFWVCPSYHYSFMSTLSPREFPGEIGLKVGYIQCRRSKWGLI